MAGGICGGGCSVHDGQEVEREREKWVDIMDQKWIRYKPQRHTHSGLHSPAPPYLTIATSWGMKHLTHELTVGDPLEATREPEQWSKRT